MEKHNKNLPSIVDALEFRRDQYGYNKREMSEALCMQPSHYSEVISGKRTLSLATTKKAFEIGVPAEVLLQANKN